MHMNRLCRLVAIAALTFVALNRQTAFAQSDAPVFVAPPRTIADITAILDQEKPDPAKVAAEKKLADVEPASGLSDDALMKFYSERGASANRLGRSTQAVADYTKALDLARRSAKGSKFYAETLSNLARSVKFNGGMHAALDYYKEEIDVLIALNSGPQLYAPYANLAKDSAEAGNFDEAYAWLAKMRNLNGSLRGPRVQPFISYMVSMTDMAGGDVALRQGKLDDAEASYRRAVGEMRQAVKDSAGQPFPPPGTFESIADRLQTGLADIYQRKGRLIEAEVEARSALLSALKRQGRYAVDSVGAVTVLAQIIAEEGRYPEAEKLARTALDTLVTMGIDESSRLLNKARVTLAATAVAQRQWKAALDQFDQVRKAFAADPQGVQAVMGQSLDFPVAAINSGRAAEALGAAKEAADYRQRLIGDTAYATQEAQGLYGAALAATGKGAEAKDILAKAMPVLLAASRHDDDEDNSDQGIREQRFRFIVEAYVGVLARQGGNDATAEGFRVADAARGQSVQRALAAAAARSGGNDPATAEIARRDQDLARSAQGLGALLVSLLALSPDQRDEKAIKDLRAEIDKVRNQRAATREDIRKRFPGYAALIDPRPATLDQVKAALQPDEALLAVYVGERETFVWAISKTGPTSFAVSKLSRDEIEKAVKALRKTLDPDAATAGDIPAFDVETSYRLYAGLLDPVKPGWASAKNLLVVANGALGQLPFGLLATQNVKPAPDQNGQPLFTGYRTVPWLIRQVAVTQLPSVTSLTTLRTAAAAKGERKPFIGFGDPWFSEKEARAAIAEQGALIAMQIAGGGLVAMRKAPVKLRSAPHTDGVDSAELAQLPRLPDTAEEVKEVASALRADPAKDVYLGAQANENIVRTMNLADRRVIMFATHGLVPGDLDGLNEPALALSAPQVAKVQGDGLLTVSKILGLHLNADWVVLSACNTAAGDGAGAEAVSGLGLAFFYAGTRALLVSNWPVETTSARMLTTELFKREAATPGLARAEGLRQAMLALIDGPGLIDPATNKPVYSYAHPIFWAPFSLVGDGGAG